ncbi:MAG: peptidylprolyl isomerase [Armatimonadetes bacterium]|nr:peptidylprolyl isomerase [Armatimonadota bacterium]MDE2205106.1 peptidylprolyl isomerase [Armatimonadota bacterium]
MKFPIGGLLLATSITLAPAGKALAQGPPVPIQQPAAPRPTGPNDVVGRVNGQPITWAQFLDFLKTSNPQQFQQAVASAVGIDVAAALFGPAHAATYTVTQAQAIAAVRANPPIIVQNGLQSMLMERALDQKAAKVGVTATPAQVQARIAELFAQLHKEGIIPAGVTDDQFLAQRNFSREQLEQNIRLQVLMDDITQKQLEQQLGHPIGPNDFLQARHILFKITNPVSSTGKPDPQANAAAQKAALAKAQQVAADIRSKKKTFAEEAKAFSDDAGTKDRGGDLGVFLRGSMVPEFDNAAFALKPGVLSQPVLSTFGYHLIEVEKLGKDISPAARETALQSYLASTRNNLMSALMSSSKIENYLRPAPPAMVPPRPGGPVPPNNGRSPQQQGPPPHHP